MKRIINGVINYLAAVGLALIFALFLSGRIGWFILAAFVCAPVISLLLTALYSSKIYVSFEADNSMVCKGDKCEVSVNVTGGMFLPSPPVRVELYDCASAVCSEKLYSVSLMPYAEETFFADYTARISGVCEIGVAKIRITDYFGIFSFTPRHVNMDKLKIKLSVIPDIAEIPQDSSDVRKAAALAAAADDSEDTTDSGIDTFGGFPGFDSREYVPGDPLKRINWKQSARRGKLLVRMDDETSCPAVTIVLDSVFDTASINIPQLINSNNFFGCTEYDVVPMAAEYAVEHALGMVQTFLGRNFSVSLAAMGENGWNVYNAADESDITQIRMDLASYQFRTDRSCQRFPDDLLRDQKGSVSVFCTPYYDEYLDEEISEYIGSSDSKGDLKTVICAAAVSPVLRSRKGAESDAE